MKIRFIAVALIVALAGFALAGDSVDVMLGKINAVKNPTFDAKKRAEAGYMDQYYSEVGKANEERAKLILEFYKAYPDNAENEKLMNQRWASLAGVKFPPTKPAIDGALADIESILAANPPAKIKQSGSFWKARYGLMGAGNDLTKVAPIVDGFTKAYKNLGTSCGFPTKDVAP